MSHDDIIKAAEQAARRTPPRIPYGVLFGLAPVPPTPAPKRMAWSDTAGARTPKPRGGSHFTPENRDKAELRRQRLIDYLAEHGKSLGSVMAQALDETTDVTLRDLRKLEADGKVKSSRERPPVGRVMLVWRLAA